MKRQFLTAVAAAAMLLGGSVSAYAAPDQAGNGPWFFSAPKKVAAAPAGITFGGTLRPRYEVWEQRAFSSNNNATHFINNRIRLHAMANINESTSAFIQLQANQTFGIRQGDATGPANANSTVNDVGFHQAFFTLKNFMGAPVDVKIGRQEVVLDGHRLFGNTIWTQGGQTHDAIRLNHHHGEHTISFIYSKAVENGIQGAGGTSTNDNNDRTDWILWANYKGLLGGQLSLYGVYTDDDRNVVNAAIDNDMWTVGARQAGQIAGIDYRGEFYYQFGNSNSNLTGTAGVGPGYTANVAGDRSAYMIGARVGKTFADVMWKPSLALWYDRLSGSDQGDRNVGNNHTFDTLYDTGHKYYGLMDWFLRSNGSDTSGLGLVDYAVKTSLTPMAGVVFKADWHLFQTAVDLSDSENATLANNIQLLNGGPGRSTSPTLGHELDFSIAYDYNPNTVISVGYSHFFAYQSLFVVNPYVANGAGASTNQDADWAYVMIDINF